MQRFYFAATDGKNKKYPWQALPEKQKKSRAALTAQPMLIEFWPDIHGADIGRRPHVDTGDNAHGKEHRDDRAAAVAEKRERKTDNGENAEAHADVDDRLRGKHACDTDADEPVHVVAGADADMDDTDNNGRQQNQHRETAQESELFADGRENEVVVLLGQRVALNHAAVIEPLTGNTAVLERADASVHLVAHALRLGVDGGRK